MNTLGINQILDQHIEGKYESDVNLKNLSSWDIGGKCDWVVYPHSIPDLCNLIKLLLANNIKWLVIGAGTNILFSDKGFRGALIKLDHSFCHITIRGQTIKCGAAVNVSALANFAAQNALSGLETLSGIPGTVGAAARFNSGAYNINFLDFVIRIHGVDKLGNEHEFDQVKSEYRESFLPQDFIITEIDLSLKKSKKEKILNQMKNYQNLRNKTQPFTQRSAGCTFKNPKGTGAGRLIDQAKLKQFRVGDAMVSDKHANFIVNIGNATASDVKKVIKHVYTTVQNEFNVSLELEINIFDEFGHRLNVGEL